MLVQHKIQDNVMKYEKNIYNMHVVTHEQQLQFDIIKRTIKYELKVLKMNTIVQSLHIATTNFGLIIKKEKKRK